MRHLALGAVLAFAATARAQSPCPDPEVEALPSEQAVCWYLEHTSGAELCAVEESGSSRCALEASRWCDRAALDDPGVASACVLSHVAAGRFDALLTVVGALPSGLSTEAESCRAVFSRPVAAELVSNPPGATLEVDGRPLGPAPLTFELSHPLQRHRVVARFGETVVTLEGEALVERFDRRTCRLAPLLLVGPPPPEPEPPSPTVVLATPPETPRRPRTVAGGVLAAVGGAVAVGGVVALALAQRSATELRADPEGTFWSSSRSDELSRIETLRPLGWAGVAVGAAAFGLGLTLVLLGDEEATDTTSLRLGVGQLELEGRF